MFTTNMASCHFVFAGSARRCYARLRAEQYRTHNPGAGNRCEDSERLAAAATARELVPFPAAPCHMNDTSP
jgi:hypothetical protein